jgi:hypothetical protein
MTTSDLERRIDALRIDLAKASWFIAGWLPGWDVARRLSAARAAINHRS